MIVNWEFLWHGSISGSTWSKAVPDYWVLLTCNDGVGITARGWVNSFTWWVSSHVYPWQATQQPPHHNLWWFSRWSDAGLQQQQPRCVRTSHTTHINSTMFMFTTYEVPHWGLQWWKQEIQTGIIGWCSGSKANRKHCCVWSRRCTCNS